MCFVRKARVYHALVTIILVEDLGPEGNKSCQMTGMRSTCMTKALMSLVNQYSTIILDKKTRWYPTSNATCMGSVISWLGYGTYIVKTDYSLQFVYFSYTCLGHE